MNLHHKFYLIKNSITAIPSGLGSLKVQFMLDGCQEQKGRNFYDKECKLLKLSGQQISERVSTPEVLSW
jgi:hypothetical protein